MDSISFKKEINSYIDATYNEFRDYQHITLEILNEFDRVCVLNRLDYYLAFGSLLGAIRDHSQIPWDYDIDTLVKIDDINKLLSILNRDLGDDYYYDYSDKSNTYPTSCLRLCKKGYSMMALHVDVFFLIGTPNDEVARNKFMNRAVKIMKLRTAKYLSRYFDFVPNSKVLRIYLPIQKKIYNLIPLCLLQRLEKRILYKYSLSSSNNWYAFQYVYKIVFPKDIFNSIKRIEVNGIKVNVPSGYEEFLSIVYGSWEKYLPIKNRFEEFYKMNNIVKERQERYLKLHGDK